MIKVLKEWFRRRREIECKTEEIKKSVNDTGKYLKELTATLNSEDNGMFRRE